MPQGIGSYLRPNRHFKKDFQLKIALHLKQTVFYDTKKQLYGHTTKQRPKISITKLSFRF